MHCSLHLCYIANWLSVLLVVRSSFVGRSHLYMLYSITNLKLVSQKASFVESVLCIFCVLQQNTCSVSSAAMCEEQIEFNYLHLVSRKAQLEVFFPSSVSKKGSNHICQIKWLLGWEGKFVIPSFLSLVYFHLEDFPQNDTQLLSCLGIQENLYSH